MRQYHVQVNWEGGGLRCHIAAHSKLEAAFEASSLSAASKVKIGPDASIDIHHYEGPRCCGRLIEILRDDGQKG